MNDLACSFGWRNIVRWNNGQIACPDTRPRDAVCIPAIPRPCAQNLPALHNKSNSGVTPRAPAHNIRAASEDPKIISEIPPSRADVILWRGNSRATYFSFSYCLLHESLKSMTKRESLGDIKAAEIMPAIERALRQNLSPNAALHYHTVITLRALLPSLHSMS